MSYWLNKVIDLRQINRLYLEEAGKWLLLEVLESGANGTPSKLRLVALSRDKEALREVVLEDENWDWNKKYLFVRADPSKPCTLA